MSVKTVDEDDCWFKRHQGKLIKVYEPARIKEHMDKQREIFGAASLIQKCPCDLCALPDQGGTILNVDIFGEQLRQKIAAAPESPDWSDVDLNDRDVLFGLMEVMFSPFKRSTP